MKKHDENKDLRSLAKVCKIESVNKVIRCNDKSVIGIKRWGMIDFLTKYRGWYFVYDKSAKPAKTESTTEKTAREVKRERKAPKLSDKRK